MTSNGYYIKARKIQESWIAHAPPHVREIWDWLLLRANFEDRKIGDKIIERGQLLTSYDDIREGLHWMVGWRKERYSKWDCEKAMKALTKATMIATQKTTRGLIVTILNYDHYQNPKSYESHTVTTLKSEKSNEINEGVTKATTKATMKTTTKATDNVFVSDHDSCENEQPGNHESHNENHRKATRKPQSRHTILEELKELKKGKDITASSRSKSNGSKPTSPPLIWIPLIGKDQEHPVYQDDIDRWQALYPAVDVAACLRRIENYFRVEQPGKRKTPRGIERCISGWLSREQDRGGGTFKRTSSAVQQSDSNNPYANVPVYK